MLFPDRWVAIKDHQVVALGDTLLELLGDAKARGHELGTFQAQLCGRDASCYTVVANCSSFVASVAMRKGSESACI